MTDQYLAQQIRRSNRNLLVTGVIFAVAASGLLLVGSRMAAGEAAPALVWGIILAVAALVPLAALAFRQRIAWHPVWRAANRYGDPDAIGREIALELVDPAVARVKSLTVTRHWLLRQRVYGMDMVRLDEVMWAYRLDTQHYVNGIKGAKTIEVKIFLRSGAFLKVQAGREHLAQRMLEQIQSNAPWAVVGYSAALEAAWKNQRTEFFAVVDGRRAAAPSDPRSAAPDPARRLPAALYPSTRGPVILLLGILGIGNPLGIVAWVLGHIERREVAKGTLAPSKSVNAGWTLGILGTAVFVLTLVVLFAAPHR